jgi:uncharacterized membrane protein YhiD involved in acid resistance
MCRSGMTWRIFKWIFGIAAAGVAIPAGLQTEPVLVFGIISAILACTTAVFSELETHFNNQNNENKITADLVVKKEIAKEYAVAYGTQEGILSGSINTINQIMDLVDIEYELSTRQRQKITRMLEALRTGLNRNVENFKRTYQDRKLLDKL